MEDEPKKRQDKIRQLRIQAYLDFGREFLRSGRYRQALAAFEEAVKIDGGLVRAHMGKSLALTRLGRFDEALAVCTEIFHLDAHSPHAYSAQGVCYQAMGLVNEARSAFEKSIQFGPELPGNHYNFACFWAAQRDAGKCHQSLQQALALDPKMNILAATDVDFKYFRQEPWFQELVAFK
jgi:Flp pilus assembly protein TadD